LRIQWLPVVGVGISVQQVAYAVERQVITVPSLYHQADEPEQKSTRSSGNGRTEHVVGVLHVTVSDDLQILHKLLVRCDLLLLFYDPRPLVSVQHNAGKGVDLFVLNVRGDEMKSTTGGVTKLG